jgi:hypothetical protein
LTEPTNSRMLPRQALLKSNLVRGEEPCADRPVSDPEFRGDLSKAVALCLQLQNPFMVNPTLWATQLLAILSRITKPGGDALP